MFSTGNDTAVSAKIPNECEVHSELAGNPNNDMNSCSHTCSHTSTDQSHSFTSQSAWSAHPIQMSLSTLIEQYSLKFPNEDYVEPSAQIKTIQPDTSVPQQDDVKLCKTNIH